MTKRRRERLARRAVELKVELNRQLSAGEVDMDTYMAKAREYSAAMIGSMSRREIRASIGKLRR